jgi:heat shock protein HslJ
MTLTSCDETRQVLNTGSRVELNGTYNVQTVNGTKSSDNQTIIFNGLGKTVSGNAGCNTYNASFTVETFQLNIGDVATTRKTCPDMKMENALIAALGKVTSYQKNGSTLTLMDANNAVIINAKAPTN